MGLSWSFKKRTKRRPDKYLERENLFGHSMDRRVMPSRDNSDLKAASTRQRQRKKRSDGYCRMTT